MSLKSTDRLEEDVFAYLVEQLGREPTDAEFNEEYELHKALSLDEPDYDAASKDNEIDFTEEE